MVIGPDARRLGRALAADATTAHGWQAVAVALMWTVAAGSVFLVFYGLVLVFTAISSALGN